MERIEDQEWDFTKARWRQPAARPRVVVAVSFATDEFERLATRAEERGLTVATLVRQLALDGMADDHAVDEEQNGKD